MGALDFLDPITKAIPSIKGLADAVDAKRAQDDQQAASITADLAALVEELRKTHAMIVKLVSPLRRIPNDPQTFAQGFSTVYYDFRDIYDAYDFQDERTHCHKIAQIGTRLAKWQPLFGTPTQCQQLRTCLAVLNNADLDI